MKRIKTQKLTKSDLLKIKGGMNKQELTPATSPPNTTN